MSDKKTFDPAAQFEAAQTELSNLVNQHNQLQQALNEVTANIVKKQAICELLKPYVAEVKDVELTSSAVQ